MTPSIRTPGARANTPWGYKALMIIQEGRRTRTHVIRRRNFPDRASALAYAAIHVARTERHAAIQKWLVENREERQTARGTTLYVRRTEAEAVEALGLEEIG